MSLFSVKKLSAGYGKDYIIQDIDFELEKGCLMGILGANGSGKTTLLKSICGILPHVGACVLDAMEFEQMSARKIAQLCSYIPQRSGISIDISVLDVVLMGFNPQLGILEHPTNMMYERARAALTQVGLSNRENENYLHLSEGQKQLCILARTLVTDSKLLLLDEPESALDFRYRYQMLEIIRKWVREKEISAIATLHDPSLALNYCDKLLILSNREVIGIIYPKKDSLEEMEQKLSRIYGPICLHIVTTRGGFSQLVMLKGE